jgi:hypothetical protein
LELSVLCGGPGIGSGSVSVLENGRKHFFVRKSALEDPGVDVKIPIFCDFRQFSAKKKLALSSKTNVMIKLKNSFL